MSADAAIAGYQALADLTRQMQTIAAAADWDALPQLELQRAQIVESLKTLEPEVSLDRAAAEQKAALIRQIKFADEEIRGKVVAAMSELSAVMESTRHARRAIRAYGA